MPEKDTYRRFEIHSKCHTLPKSLYDSVQSLFPLSAEELLLRPSTKYAITAKGRDPGFHNSDIDMIFAGETVNKVRGLLDNISHTQICQRLRRAKTKSGLVGKPGWGRKSCPFRDAMKVVAIVAEKCYQTTCKLTQSQTMMTRTIFMLFLCKNHIDIRKCVVSLRLAILTKISQKAVHALLAKVTKKNCRKTLGATDIQLIPYFVKGNSPPLTWGFKLR